MDEESAKKLVKETLQSPFDKERFAFLVNNILNHTQKATFTYKGKYIFSDFADSIRTVERIGKYKDPNDKLLDILIIHLHSDTSLERARTRQRNYVAKYLQSRGDILKDAALVAFVAPNSADWRFSFVKMEYRFNEKGKVQEEFTPARRYSFLVGENENSHTAQHCFLPILLNDEENPTLEQLEEAFSVEKVTREFFEKYRELFLRLKESLDAIVAKDATIKANFEEKNVETGDFAKKLLGQIVFLYFLQKKGWFGVKIGEAWGSGSKHFLRELFDKKHGDYKNFFNDIWEPLLYEALRSERTDDYYSRFKCRIPFLNGGLFDPINEYDWVNTDILLPDELFSNKNRTKEGDTGDGILDIFDRYNFTVKEDEPLEKEVAVDPEMLGKVFENLLAVNDRKSKGTYYTPREIVHYMCQQSLIYYLYSELNRGIVAYEHIDKPQIRMFGNEVMEKQLPLTIEHRPRPLISKEDIETLIQYGETSVEHDTTHMKKTANNANYKGTYDKAKLPESIGRQATRIDEMLKSIRVCDPAVGSGAFVVGMMNEIIRTRNALTPHCRDTGIPACAKTSTSTDKNVCATSRSPYDFKRQAIRNCLYGVDIDPGAVEIAKLRLWLSLIVDEEERETIQPLPNLDYKIVQGNSLLSINKLFHHQLSKQVEELKTLHFNETGANKKQQYKKEINELISEITGGHKEFDFEVYFSEVFHEKKGFDVVIGNPPYVQLQKDGGSLSKLYQNQGYKTFAKTGVIYQLLYEKGLGLLKEPRGILAFITSNSWMCAQYGGKLREFFSENHSPLQLIDMGKDAFDAIVDTNILLVSKGSTGQKCKAVDMDSVPENHFPPAGEYWSEIQPSGDVAWSILSPAAQRIRSKIEEIGTPLRDWDIEIKFGIKTGCNEAFIITQSKRDELIATDPKSAEIIKPIVRGRDIRRYGYEWAGKWIITTFPTLNINIDDYPAIKKYLLAFGKDRLEQAGKQLANGAKSRKKTGNKWFETQDQISYYKEFEKEKLIWKRIGSILRFSFDDKGCYPLDSTCIATGERVKFLVAVFNSRLGNYLLQDSPTTGMGDLIVSVQAIEPIHVPKVSTNNYQIAEGIEGLVDQILTAKAQDPNADTSKLEAEIDQLVYKLYNLTPNEIEIIEESHQ